MGQNTVTVVGSIEFRDVVMTLDRAGGKEIFAGRADLKGPTYRIIPRHADQFQKITVDDLFGSDFPPIYMEDFAQALIAAGDSAPLVYVFTQEALSHDG
jgi:hypothetical protein